MPDRSCSVDDCIRPLQSRGWCGTHYARWKKYGTTELPPKPAPVACSVEGCDTRSATRGMCRIHYNRDYHSRNKERASERFRAWRLANLDAEKARWAAYAEERWGEERAARATALAERLAVDSKVCTRCHEDKPKAEFNTDDRRRDGLYSWCKSCFYGHVAEMTDPVKVRERRRWRYQNDPEYRARRAADAKRWRTEKYANDEAWRDAIRQRVREWAEANPDKVTIYSRRAANARRARIRDQSAGPVDYVAILDRDGMICHLCDEDIEAMTDLHFDHVIPLSKFGPHHEGNIRPAHAQCNLRKGAKIL